MALAMGRPIGVAASRLLPPRGSTAISGHQAATRGPAPIRPIVRRAVHHCAPLQI